MSDTTKNNIKGFITDLAGNAILPITRGELVLDANANVALHSDVFAANTNRYGLLSPTHYALLESLGSAGDTNTDSLANIIAKLKAINEGIKVDNKILYFYDTNNQSTPITFTSSDTVILAAETDNKITASLYTLTEKPTITENVVANVTVDEYGRVTEISPTTALSNVCLSGCTSKDISETASEYAIVNKKYVDGRFNDISAISTGALKFNGRINSTNDIGSLLINGCYYLSSIDATLNPQYVHYTETAVSFKVGDTLIAHEIDDVTKFIIIPSGDDETIINLYATKNNNPQTIGAGRSNILFNDPFELSYDNNSDTTIIKIPEATSENAGIISSDLFKQITQATAKSMSYDPIITDGLPIGQIKIGDELADPIDIEIPNYSLKYDNNAIKWSGYDEALNIQFGQGLLHNYEEGTSTIQVNLGTDNKYLTVDDGVLTAVISTFDKDASKYTPGLIDNTLFGSYVTTLATAAYYRSILKSLNSDDVEDDDGKNYQYGSQALMDAVDVKI